MKGVMFNIDNGYLEGLCRGFKNGKRGLTLFYPVFLVLINAGGGQICPHPLKMVGNGWEVPKLSWNLISYRD